MTEQTHLFTYEFHGARWQIEVPATSEVEARHRIEAMQRASYDGVLVAKIGAPIGWLARLIGRIRQP